MSINYRGQGRIGVFVPFTNSNLEPDLAMMRPDGVSLHFTRLGGYEGDEVPDSSQMAGLGEADLSHELRLMQGVNPDIVMYGCTSATLALGPQFDRDLACQIAKSSHAKSVTAAGALIFALNRLGVRKIAFASPYVSELNDRAVRYLHLEGIETVSRKDIGCDLGNAEQGALTPKNVFELGRAANHAQADAIVLSCTDMRSVEIIEQLERECNKPVVTSNQAMMFQAIKLAGFPPPPSGFGRLFGAL